MTNKKVIDGWRAVIEGKTTLECGKCGSTDEVIEVDRTSWKFVLIGQGDFNLCRRCYSESGSIARAYLMFNAAEYEQLYGRKLRG